MVLAAMTRRQNCRGVDVKKGDAVCILLDECPCRIGWCPLHVPSQSLRAMPFEMDAIASSYIGGTAVSGGILASDKRCRRRLRDRVSLTNGMNLMGVDISYRTL